MQSSIPDAVTLLVVDDDEIDVRSITRALRKRGVENPIAVAKDGFQALETLRGENGRTPPAWPFVILLDLNMPRMNGIEFLEAMRGDPALGDTVVFVLTTSDDDQDKVAAYRHHVAGYILKSNAGGDFIDVVSMLEKFVLTVRFPKRGKPEAA